MDISNNSNPVRVVMLPWLAHGHTSPFLELAKRLTTRNFYVYLVSTPINLASVKPQIGPNHSPSLQLVELHLPTLPDLPPSRHTTNGLPPHLMSTLKRAFELSSPAFSLLLETLKPDVVIYDFNQPWAADAALSHDIPCVQFLPIGAIAFSFGLHDYLIGNGQKYPFPEIYLHKFEGMKLQDLRDVKVNEVKDMDRFSDAMNKSCGMILVKSFTEIEGKYIDHFSQLAKKKVVPVGPLVQEPFGHRDEDGEIMQWLREKEKKSVVFVSFGTEYFLSEEEREEIARGLEDSNLNFIWVIRFPVGKEIPLRDALPEGFLERVGGRGLAVEGWAPQAKILGHPSTGGFLSHCGWSSVVESMRFGVPIVALPMHLDQPLNARVVAAVGAGVEAKRDGSGKVERAAISKALRLVVAEESGERVRKKSRELSECLKTKGEYEIDEVAAELIKLCRSKSHQN